MKFFWLFGAAMALTLGVMTSALGQTWQGLVHQPSFSAGNELLMTDGTIFVQAADNSAWWKLTPDSTGSYLNGTWTQLASTPGYGPLYYASQVLPDGRVFTMGGEYNFGSQIWQNQGFIYSPQTNTWASQAAPTGWNQMGDTGSIVLPNGLLMLADPLSTQDALFFPSTNTFTVPYGTGKADGNDEEGLTLLPNGNILTVDAVDEYNSEIFNVATATWSTAGTTPELLVDPSSEEIGPAVLRPDGTIIYFGGTGHNCVYNTNTMSWEPASAAPDFPVIQQGQLDCADAPACLLPSGNVLVQAGVGIFNAPSEFFEWNGATLTQVPSPPNASTDPSYVGTMLMLPTGQVLYTDQSNNMQIYTPLGTPNPAWAPTITTSPTTMDAGSSYTISGTQFNGLSGCSAYGDDEQNETNYPQIRLTNTSTGQVTYCWEFNPSGMGIVTGANIVSTNFTVPSGLASGAYTIQVVTNGIPSLGVPITVMGASFQVSSISPTSSTVNQSVTLTVNGSGFVSNSTVQFNGSNLTTTYVSSTQIKGALTPHLTATAGTYPVTVLNPGNQTSNSVTFTVKNPVPTLNTVSPNSIPQGSGNTTIAVTGFAFVPTSSVLINGTAVSTTYGNADNLTAVVPASYFASTGTLNVQVSSPAPGGGTSGKKQITVSSGSNPNISSISPTSSSIDTAFTLTVNGTNFVSGSVVQWNGTALATSFVSSTQVTASVTSTQTASAGTYPITVVNPGPVTSNSVNITITGAPTISSLSPSSSAIDASFTLTVNGTNFVSSSVVQWNGTNLTTTYVSSTQVTASVTSTQTATAGSYPITVLNPANVLSNSVNFTVSGSLSITTISPTQTTLGEGATVTINGTGFVSNSQVQFNGTNITTTYISSTQLKAAVTSHNTGTVGSYPITVVNPGPVTSNSVNFNVVYPVPTLNTVSPNSIAVGSGNTTITLTGFAFVPVSTVLINGTAVSTTYVSAGTLTAVVPASFFASAGSLAVQVTTPSPGGGTSGKKFITVS